MLLPQCAWVFDIIGTTYVCARCFFARAHSHNHLPPPASIVYMYSAGALISAPPGRQKARKL